MVESPTDFIDNLFQVLANFSCERTESKHFLLCKLGAPCYNDSTLVSVQVAIGIAIKMNEHKCDMIICNIQ